MDNENLYTPSANNVLRIAQEQARFFKHQAVGTEHLLLALSLEKVGVAATVLHQFNVTSDDLREEIERYTGYGTMQNTASDAYSQFKKRKGARASIEALLKRANQGHVFEPTIPLVDLYNSVSLSYGVPVGIEDLDKIEGDLHLGLAKGGEGFFPLGAEEDDPAREGEVIYYDNGGAVCRSLNWREAERTMLTEATTNGVAVMESVNAEQAVRATEAMVELSKLVADFFKVTPSEQFILTKDHPEVTVD